MRSYCSKIIYNCQDACEKILSITKHDRIRIETTVNYYFTWMATIKDTHVVRTCENKLGSCACMVDRW